MITFQLHSVICTFTLFFSPLNRIVYLHGYIQCIFFFFFFSHKQKYGVACVSPNLYDTMKTHAYTCTHLRSHPRYTIGLLCFWNCICTWFLLEWCVHNIFVAIVPTTEWCATTNDDNGRQLRRWQYARAVAYLVLITMVMDIISLTIRIVIIIQHNRHYHKTIHTSKHRQGRSHSQMATMTPRRAISNNNSSIIHMILIRMAAMVG